MNRHAFWGKLLLLAAVLAVAVLYCGTAFAETSGTCGENLTWVLDDAGNLTISGTGEMDTDFYAPWGNEIKTAEIEAGVTSIGNGAFVDCGDLESIVIPESVTSIGESAFADCRSLTDISIPDAVTRIEGYTFLGCKSLSDITIPEGVTYIGDQAFYGCDNLSSITIPDSVTTILWDVFASCENLQAINVSIGNPAFASVDGVLYNKDITELQRFPAGKGGTFVVPESVKKIYADAFSDCTALTGVTIQEGVTYIYYNAFSGCTALTSVTIPESVMIIGIDVFSDCSVDLIVTVPGDSAARQYCIDNNICYVIESVGPEIVTSGACGDDLSWTVDSLKKLTISGTGMMDNSTYEKGGPWGTAIKTAVIEQGVTSIGNYAFFRCSALTDITIPDSVTLIDEYAFSGCHSLIEIIIPEGVTNFGYSAIKTCNNLESVVIPSSVKTIGEWLFYECPKLVVKVPADSVTLKYCIANGIKYEIISAGPEIVDSGTCGDTLTWTLDSEGNLLISGTGTMYSYYPDGGPWGNGIKTVLN